jgi:hypothetical protein
MSDLLFERECFGKEDNGRNEGELIAIVNTDWNLPIQEESRYLSEFSKDISVSEHGQIGV